MISRELTVNEAVKIMVKETKISAKEINSRIKKLMLENDAFTELGAAHVVAKKLGINLINIFEKEQKQIIEELEQKDSKDLIKEYKGSKDINYKSLVLGVLEKFGKKSKDVEKEIFKILKNKNEIPSLRIDAFKALLEISGVSEQFLNELKEIQSSDVIISVLQVIRRKSYIIGIEHIIELYLDDDDYKIRRNAIISYSRIGKDKAIPKLVSALKEEQNNIVFHVICSELGNLVAISMLPEIMGILDQMIVLEGYQYRRKTYSLFNLLGTIGDVTTIDYLANKIHEISNTSIFRDIISTISEIGGKKATDVLIGFLKADSLKREHAFLVSLLTQLRVKKAIKPISGILKKEYIIRQQFMMASNLAILEESSSGAGIKHLVAMERKGQLNKLQSYNVVKLRNDLSAKVQVRSVTDIYSGELTKRFIEEGSIDIKDLHMYSEIEIQMLEAKTKQILIDQENERLKLAKLEVEHKEKWVVKHYQLIDFIVKVILAVISTLGLIAIAIITALLTKNPPGT